MTHAPVATVAALRETSILFGMAIAALVLHERIGAARLAAAALIVAGAVVRPSGVTAARRCRLPANALPPNGNLP